MSTTTALTKKGVKKVTPEENKKNIENHKKKIGRASCRERV